jgi:tagaturonate reductase
MTAIFQFGTSRFLQAHVDLFASQAREAGQSVPPIIVVQTTMDPQRARRVAAFGAPEGYPVILRGLAEITPPSSRRSPCAAWRQVWRLPRNGRP